MQLISLTGFIRKLPLFKMRCAGERYGGFSMWWTTRNGCFEKCPSWNDCSHFVCSPSAIARMWEQTQGGLLSTGLIEHLDFQEDLKPSSARTPEKSLPGSALCHNPGAPVQVPVEAGSGDRSSPASPGCRFPNPGPSAGACTGSVISCIGAHTAQACSKHLNNAAML